MNNNVENLENNSIDKITGKCPECGSENISLTLETSNGFRYRCNNCDETFVVSVRLLGERLGDLSQDAKKVIEDKVESDERKTIKIPKRSYVKLESIRQEIGLSTLVEANVYAINQYSNTKKFNDFELKIIGIFNEFSETSFRALNQFYEDNKEELKKIQGQLEELKVETTKNRRKKEDLDIKHGPVPF
jgi:transposase-like protein